MSPEGKRFATGSADNKIKINKNLFRTNEALRIEGAAEVPDCLPSPIQGNSFIPLKVIKKKVFTKKDPDF